MSAAQERADAVHQARHDVETGAPWAGQVAHLLDEVEVARGERPFWHHRWSVSQGFADPVRVVA